MANYYLNIQFDHLIYPIHIKYFHLNKSYSAFIDSDDLNPKLNLNMNYYIKNQINLLYIEINNHPIRLNLSKLVKNHYTISKNNLIIKFALISIYTIRY